MFAGLGFVLFLLIVLLLILVATYNRLVSVKNNVTQAYANIDVLLKRRHDELPKLVDTCKVSMNYEKDLLEKITELREAVNKDRQNTDIKALGNDEGALRAALGQLNLRMENYPDLKANQSLMQLLNEISNLEGAISDKRELYNYSVALNNTAIESFPANVIVGFCPQFTHCDSLEIAESDKADVNITAAFSGQ